MSINTLKNENRNIDLKKTENRGSFLSIYMINEENFLEFSNNKILQIITKILIFKKVTITEKFENIKEDSRFKKLEPHYLSRIFKKIVNILNKRSNKTSLNPHERKFIKHITRNLITERGKLNKNEALKIIRTKLFLNTALLNEEIIKILNSIELRIIDLEKYSIPKYILPKNSNMYLIEKKNNHLLGVGPKFIHINSHVLFFNKYRIFGLGLLHSISKEGVINNFYKIIPFLIITNDNAIHTEDLLDCEFPVKNVPFCVINPEESEYILNQISEVKEFVSLGGRLVGDQLMKKSTNSILWYNLNYDSLLDMFEKRILVYGTPSSGKSILGVQILRYLGSKKRKLIAIAPNNPNLAKLGLQLKNIGSSNPKWNLDNIGEKYIQMYGCSKLERYSMITLGENYFMPDIEMLNKKTIISLINEVTDLVQIKNLLALEMVDNSIVDILQKASNETLLDEDDFQQNQIKTVKRVANILLKWQKIGKKINLKKRIFHSDILSLGFYVNSDLFLPELNYVLLAEIFYNSQPCFDIKQDGFFLMVDEIPLLMTSDGVLIKGKNIGRLFTQISKQGRNMGILLGCIIQDYNSKIQRNFLPDTLEDYCTFHLEVKHKRRILKLNRENILIPPITNI